jgi:alpha-amylase
MKKLAISLLTVATVAGTMSAKDRITHDANATNTETILHAFCWNFPTIAENMKAISEAGFSFVQTSPVQNCFNPAGSSKKIFDPNVTEGNWYYYYQPTDWKIGNQILGTRDQFAAMMDSADKYDVKIIVDVLPNHTAFDVDCVSDEFFEAVGGRDKMYHSNGLTEVGDYNDRAQCTLQGCGGLPDVNTENPKFQKYYMTFVNDLLSLGVKGFRYDTAKHIGVHSDPKDTVSGVKENDFWDVATGRKSVLGVKLAVPADELFIYGEVLQDKNVPEAEYADYMGQTASSYGYVLREMLEKKSAKGIDVTNWCHNEAPEYLTTWVESHDTYCNANESAGLTDEQIRVGWVFLTARQNGTPLFFSRPNNSTRQNYFGDNVLGARGNDEFFNQEVVAVNKFRKQMNGQKEDVEVMKDGNVLLVNRGKKGAAIVNITERSAYIDLPTGLPNGTYKDQVYGKEFKVKNGRLTGITAPMRSYILVK